MKTEKEKAKELIEDFSSISKENGKGSALRCAEEVIEQWEYIDTYLADLNGKLNPNYKYWLKVRKEIQEHES